VVEGLVPHPEESIVVCMASAEWACFAEARNFRAGGAGPHRDRRGTIAGTLRLGSSPIRSNHKAGDDYRTSLEEAAVSRPGRKAGIKNNDAFEMG
jgi:hypothetical protein